MTPGLWGCRPRRFHTLRLGSSPVGRPKMMITLPTAHLLPPIAKCGCNVAVCQYPEPGGQNQDEDDHGISEDLSGHEQEVEGAVQGHAEKKPSDDDPGAPFGRHE